MSFKIVLLLALLLIVIGKNIFILRITVGHTSLSTYNIKVAVLYFLQKQWDKIQIQDPIMVRIKKIIIPLCHMCISPHLPTLGIFQFLRFNL